MVKTVIYGEPDRVIWVQPTPFLRFLRPYKTKRFAVIIFAWSFEKLANLHRSQTSTENLEIRVNSKEDNTSSCFIVIWVVRCINQSIIQFFKASAHTHSFLTNCP